MKYSRCVISWNMPCHPWRIGGDKYTKIKTLKLHSVISSFCYQIQVEIVPSGTPSINVFFPQSCNHQLPYEATPSYKDNPGHNLLKHVLPENTICTYSFHESMYCFPPLPAMLVSRVWLGINVFEINIEWEEKKKFPSVLAILDSITREDVYVIFVEMVDKMARINDKWRNTNLNVSLYWPEFIARPL